MVTSAVLGAATGTGLALVIAMTIVIYRHYIRKKKGVDWGDLERFESPHLTSGAARHAHASTSSQGVSRHGSHSSTATGRSTGSAASTSEQQYGHIKRWDSRGSRTSTKSCPPLYTYPQQEFNLNQEQRIIQPTFQSLSEGTEYDGGEHSYLSDTAIGIGQQRAYPSQPKATCCSSYSSSVNVPTTHNHSLSHGHGHHQTHSHGPSSGGNGNGGEMLTHQSRSLPSGPPIRGARLNRTPSISSQGHIESAVRKGHRGSSPAIRTFTPEGLSTGVSPPDSPTCQNQCSRSPSPLQARTASLEMKSGSPNSSIGDLHGNHGPGGGGNAAGGVCMGDPKTPSQSQSSLNSLSDKPLMPGNSLRRGSRCLSPLLIPPRSPTLSESSSQSPGPVSPLLGSLQLDLYQKKDVTIFLPSTIQPGSSPHDKTNPLGRLHLRLKYDLDKSDLHVHVIEAHDLTGSDQGGFNDPYIRLFLSPEVDGRKRQTNIHRNDPNPFFDEHFKFPISQDELKERILILQVYDYDRYSRNDVVGEVTMRLEDFNVTTNLEIWAEVVKNKKPSGERQEILVSLSYLPSAERLTVVLLKARNLYSPPNKDTLDPYVKVYLVVGGKRLKKKKSSARKNTNDPVWNEAYSFSVPSSTLATSAIEICVLDQSNDLMGSSASVGSCLIGPQETGTELSHWNDMTQNFRKSIAMWHVLT